MEGTAIWADISESTPLRMAARKGAHSTFSRRARSPLSVAMFMCVSVAVSPWPGKCFAVTMIGAAAWAPSMKAETMAETSSGFSPNERILMIGLSGLLFTSASGKNIHWIPRARASRAVISPSRLAVAGSREAVSAMAWGKTVVASTRMEAPRSRSPEMRRGTLAIPCMRLAKFATSRGDGFTATRPFTTLIRIRPPMCSFCTSRTRVRYSFGRVFEVKPLKGTTMSCAARSRGERSAIHLAATCSGVGGIGFAGLGRATACFCFVTLVFLGAGRTLRFAGTAASREIPVRKSTEKWAAEAISPLCDSYGRPWRRLSLGHALPADVTAS